MQSTENQLRSSLKYYIVCIYRQAHVPLPLGSGFYLSTRSLPVMISMALSLVTFPTRFLAAQLTVVPLREVVAVMESLLSTSFCPVELGVIVAPGIIGQLMSGVGVPLA